ncbi:Fc.00g028100.m01.CDS01 [Cosmosporella sp. VM-42]
MDTTPAPVPPNDSEGRLYYHGIGGYLIARTSTFGFCDKFPDWMGPEIRRFFAIGQHEILALWTDELIRSIQSVLEDTNWQRFYPIRIGRFSSMNPPIGKPDRALVLTIDVPESSTDWDTAIKAALKCRDVLQQAGIPDIEVDVRGVNRTFLAVDANLEKAVEEREQVQGTLSLSNVLTKFFYQDLPPFLSNIGYQIAPEVEADAYFGTMGLHLRLSGRPSEFYGLTCRHVAHRPVDPTLVPNRYQEIRPHTYSHPLPSLEPNGANVSKKDWISDYDGYQFQDKESRVRHRIVQVCPEGLVRIRRSMETHIKWADRCRQRLLTTIQTYEKEPNAQQKPTEYEPKELKQLSHEITFAREVHKVLTADTIDSAEGRAIGHISDMPPLEVADSGLVRDWALIRLGETKFSKPPTNHVLIQQQDLNSLGSVNRRRCRERDKEDEDYYSLMDEERIDMNKFRLLGTLPTTEIDARKSFWVGKRGARTGITYGIVNEIKAVVRAPASHTGEDRAITWEWIVVSAAGPRKQLPFARPGDSGAAVFDFQGRVIGLIGSGFDHGRGNGRVFDADDDDRFGERFRDEYRYRKDLTFVTPIEVVLEDIRNVTGCEVEIL